MKQSDTSAFTLVETLIIIGIVGLFTALSFVSFAELSRREALSANAAALSTRLRDARARTIASVDGMQHGVYVATSSITFFKGSVYNPVSPSNDVFPLSSYVQASTSLSSIVFSRITGNSSASGTIELFLVSDPSKKKTVTVQSSGLVNVQ